MSIFKRKKKVEQRVVAMTTLLRNALYDAGLKEPSMAADLLELPRISDEVHEMEVRASEERLSQIEDLEPIVAVLSATIGRAIARYQNQQAGDIVGEESLIAFEETYAQVAHGASNAVLSALMELELIDYK